MQETGETVEAERVMTRVNNSSSLGACSYGYEHGLAGIGLTNLYFFKATKKQQYLTFAKNIFEQILATAIRSVGKVHWFNDENVSLCGLESGATGVALFALRLYQTTGDDYYLVIGEEALSFDTDNLVVTDHSCSLKRSDKSNVVSPYLFSGTAGLVAVILRFYELNHNISLLNLANKLKPDITRKYMANTGYSEGLAGLGTVLLDYDYFLDDDTASNEAWRIFDALQLYKVKLEHGNAYPGTLLLRISDDFETGTLGIAHFYQRLICPEVKEEFFLDCL